MSEWLFVAIWLVASGGIFLAVLTKLFAEEGDVIGFLASCAGFGALCALLALVLSHA